GVGISLTGGSATVERSKVINNTLGGILVDGGGMLGLVNSFAGGDQSDQRAVDIADGSGIITYSTLAAGFGDDTAYALYCTNATDTFVRNSLLVARTGTPEMFCDAATASGNALEMSKPGNTMLPAFATNWFTGWAAGEFFLSGTHPEEIEAAAQWQTGDAATDIQGTPRPTTDGSSDFAGAHTYVP